MTFTLPELDTAFYYAYDLLGQSFHNVVIQHQLRLIQVQPLQMINYVQSQDIFSDQFHLQSNYIHSQKSYQTSYHSQITQSDSTNLMKQNDPISIKSQKKQKKSEPKTKMNESDYENHDDYMQTVPLILKNKKKGISKKQRNQYHTKNFLPSFRQSFLNYLKINFDQKYFFSHPIISHIKRHKCINMQDYQELLNCQEFRPYLKVYFEDKVIYRDLQMSRIKFATKMNYLKRIHVFEQAFISRIFNKIN